MKCPKCGSRKVYVKDVVHEFRADDDTYRKRKCSDCSHSFYTVEYPIEVTKGFEELWRKNYRKKREKSNGKQSL